MSKKITIVSSSIYNLIGKQEPVRCIRVITMEYLFNDADRFTPVLIDSLLEGNGLRFRNFLKWANVHGYNKYMRIESPKIRSNVSLDTGALSGFIENQIESIGKEPELEYTVKEDIFVRKPNPEYVPDPDTGEYPDVPEYLYEEYKQFPWEYKRNRGVLIDYSYYGNWDYSAGAYVILSMWCAKTLKDLNTDIYNVIEGEDTITAYQIERNGNTYIRLGDLTSFSNGVYDDIETDLNQDQYWDAIYKDIDITSIVSGTTLSTDFIMLLVTASYSNMKAVYATTRNPDDITDNNTYIILDSEGKPTLLEWESQHESAGSNEVELFDATWSNFNKMGPLVTQDSPARYVTKYGFIYSLPSGIPELDKYLPASTSIDDDYWGSWFPLRWENHSINEKDDAYLWEWGEKFCWKLYKDKGKVAELIESVNSNKQIGDIDFCYLEIGIPINVQQKYVCRYMLEFWKLMYNRLSTAPSVDENGDYYLDLEYPTRENPNWQDTYIYSYSPGSTTNPDDNYKDDGNYPPSEPGWEPPPFPPEGMEIGQTMTTELGTVYKLNFKVRLDSTMYKCASGATINITSSGNYNRNISISHGGMLYESITGNLGRDPGDCWGELQTETFYTCAHVTKNTWTGYDGENYSQSYNAVIKVTANWICYYRQITSNTYEFVKICSIKQRNVIKNGKSVDHDGVSEFNLPEEDGEYSGVLIPLSYEAMKSISLLDATDCTQFASSLRFNCYVVKKKKWYQSGFFGALIKIAGIVISVVVAIVATPAGGAAVGSGLAGLMGVTSAIGTAIINAVANAVIAVVVTSVVSPVLKDLLGDVIGGILTAIVTIAVTWGINYGITNGFDLSSLSNEFMKIDNILAIAKSIGNAYMEILQGDMQDLQNDIQNFQNRYNETSDELSSAIEANLSGFGMNQYWQQLYYRNNALNSVIESRDRFLDRTLMLADDAIDIQMQWIEDLPKLTIRDNPTTNIIN